MKKKATYQKALVVHRSHLCLSLGDARLEADETGDTLDSLQKLVKGYIELYRDPGLPGLDLFINEEGRLKGMEPTLYSTTGELIVGPIVITAHDKRGETRSLTKREMEMAQQWLYRCAERTL